MQVFTAITSIVALSVKTISDKEKRLRFVVEKRHDGLTLPYSDLMEGFDALQSAESLAREILDTPSHMHLLGVSSAPGLIADGKRIIKFTYYIVVPEDHVALKSTRYEWIEHPSDQQWGTGHGFKEDVEETINLISQVLKGVDFIECILDFLPTRFKSRDADAVARNFGKERKTMFIFYRYLREQTNPELAEKKRIHLQARQKVRQVSIESINKDSKKRGKPAIIYEKQT